MKIKKIIKIIASKFWRLTYNKNLNYGCNIYGFFEDWHSIAISGRMFVNSFNAAGIPFILKNIGHSSKNSVEYERFKEKYGSVNNGLKNIYLTNLDTIADLSRIYMKTPGKKTAFVFWEYETGLDEFINSFDYIDEVYACTDLIYNAVKNIAPSKIKVTKIPIPFYQDYKITKTKEEIRERYNLNKNDFLFFFNFDYGSSYDRKNPEAIIKAFKKAFNGKNDVKLVLKTNRSKNFPQSENLNQLIKEMQLNNNIIIINDFLSRQDLIDLMYCTNCYVSLHRGEGLGLGMLEAMSLALPVIATNYGGNTDFCNAYNCLLVNYELVKCEDKCNPTYKNVQKWAEPDINQASQYMKKVFEDKEFAIKLGQKAKEYVKITFKPENFANAMLKFNWNIESKN